MPHWSSKAVIGLGFGDEGKGLVTNALAHQLDEPLVIRYSGGQQAGHTVCKDGTYHVFSNFGSGSIAGAPTYWSKNCTMDPVGIMRELEVLQSIGCDPLLIIDRKCPVTTPLDKYYNRCDSANEKHGTCGVGVGATWKREEAFHSILAEDLQYPEVLNTKFGLLADYYGYIEETAYKEDFFRDVYELLETPFVQFGDYIPPLYKDGIPRKFDHIFEGSQGLLLDQNIGFFPHVTRSNTGTKNILDLTVNPELYLVTRAYQTRHGNGPMTNTDRILKLRDNPYETNINNKYQGQFRKTILDASLLDYAIKKDPGIRTSDKRILVITCCDQVLGDFSYTINGKLYTEKTAEKFGEVLSDLLQIPQYILVDNPESLMEVNK